MCYWMSVCLCMCCCLCVHICVCTGMHLYIYTHISAVCCLERGETKEESLGRKELVRWEKGLLQSELLFLFNFMVAEGLFWFKSEMSVLWRILLSDDDDQNQYYHHITFFFTSCGQKWYFQSVVRLYKQETFVFVSNLSDPNSTQTLNQNTN